MLMFEVYEPPWKAYSSTDEAVPQIVSEAMAAESKSIKK